MLAPNGFQAPVDSLGTSLIVTRRIPFFANASDSVPASRLGLAFMVPVGSEDSAMFPVGSEDGVILLAAEHFARARHMPAGLASNSASPCEPLGSDRKRSCSIVL